MDDEPEWSPEREREEDPARMQREYMAFARKYLGHVRELVASERQAHAGDVHYLEAPKGGNPMSQIIIRLIGNVALVAYPTLTADEKAVEMKEIYFMPAGNEAIEALGKALASLERVKAWNERMAQKGRAIMGDPGPFAAGVE